MLSRRRSFALGSAFTLVLGVAAVALGHGGGLDSKGGHYNRKTGEYHYHRKVADAPATQSLTSKAPAATPVQGAVVTAQQLDVLLTMLVAKGTITADERAQVLLAGLQ